MKSAYQPRRTLLLSPRPPGCGWIDGDNIPRCSEPVAYLLICEFTGMEAQACVKHTAVMRAEHPDWIAQVASAPSTASSVDHGATS